MLATVLLAQGTPMLAAGDELGHSQQGNNNAYCQDNPISWIDWQAADATLTAFVAKLTALRRELPALRQARWLSDLLRADGRRDVDWRDPAGHEMTVARWHDTARRCLTVTLAPEDAEPVLLIFNAEPTAHECVLPAGRWRRVLDSSDPGAQDREVLGSSIEAPPQSALVLRTIH
jgi:glycogen operon protein